MKALHEGHEGSEAEGQEGDEEDGSDENSNEGEAQDHEGVFQADAHRKQAAGQEGREGEEGRRCAEGREGGEEDGSDEAPGKGDLGGRRAEGQEGDEEDGSDGAPGKEGRPRTEGQEGDEEGGGDAAPGKEGRPRTEGQEGDAVLGITMWAQGMEDCEPLQCMSGPQGRSIMLFGKLPLPPVPHGNHKLGKEGRCLGPRHTFDETGRRSHGRSTQFSLPGIVDMRFLFRLLGYIMSLLYDG